MTYAASPYELTVDWLIKRYGPQYESIAKSDKAYIAFLLALAIDGIDEGWDAREIWDKLRNESTQSIPEGFDFGGVEGRSLDLLIRSQFRTISTQIGGGV